MDDKPKTSFNNLTIIGIIAIILVVGIGLVASGAINIAGNSSSKNPSQMSAEIINYTSDSTWGVSDIKIKLKGSNLPEGQKNYFKVVGNLNGTPDEELWYTFPEGSKLANGMILTISDPNDLGVYDSFTVYLYDKPLYNENYTAQYPDPIFNITINNTAYKK